MNQFSMVNTVADMQRIMDEVDVLLASRPVSAKRKFAVRLALDELLSNVIRHAHDDQGVHPIAVRLELDAPARLTIEDDGKPFNPLEDAPAPVLDGPVEDRPIGGLGLQLLQSMGMKLDYRRENGRNLLRVDFPAD
jgi:anti-sigma regulatory factor (Ser/Thr protein kinase)